MINKDICAAVVSLLQEMTDIESSEESIENIKVLIDYLVFQILKNKKKIPKQNSKTNLMNLFLSVISKYSRYWWSTLSDSTKRIKMSRRRSITL